MECTEVKIHKVACNKHLPLAQSPQVHLSAVDKCTSVLQLQLIQPKTSCRKLFFWVTFLGEYRTNCVVANKGKSVEVFNSTLPLLVWHWEYAEVIWGQRNHSLVLCVLLKYCTEPSKRFLQTRSWLCSSCHSCLCFVCLCYICNCLTSLDKMHRLRFRSLRDSQCGTQKLDASKLVPFHPRPRPLLCSGQSERRSRHSCVVWRLDSHGKVSFLLFSAFYCRCYEKIYTLIAYKVGLLLYISYGCLIMFHFLYATWDFNYKQVFGFMIICVII